MVILLLAATILVLAAVVLDILAMRKTLIRIETSGGIQERNHAGCRITVRNTGVLPVIYKRLVIRVSNMYTGETRRRRIRVNVLPRSVSEINIGMIVKHCGKIRCGVGSRHFRAEQEHCNYTVLPDIFPVHVVYDLHESDIFDCETYSPYRKGQDYSEVFQIREYVPGDSIKHVHWKLSGRSDELMVKEASFPLDRSIMVIMDKSIPDGDCDPETAEALAALTVSVCRYLSDEELDYQLVWNDPETSTCECRRIQFEEELAEAIPGILTGTVRRSDLNCAQLFLQTIGPCTATHVIYISCGIQAEAGNLFEGCRITDIDAREQDYRSRYREIDLY